MVLFFAGCKKDDILEEGEVLYKFAVTTNNITDIKSTTAQCGGDVSLTSVDGLKVTARGVCWSTKPNPTINDNKTSDGSGTGNFTSNLINLTDNTTYYVRAYATNEKGTSYGEVKSFKTLPIINGHEYVDLGLPSGLKWATCNVGADSPEGYGNYYAWGETETKTEYTQDNSLTYGLTKYELKSQGYIDGSGNLTPSHDAATANWGGSWRMPTEAELEELKNICTWTWITQNGVMGYNVTGPNGNSIFLPAAGSRYGASLHNVGIYGKYWSSTPFDGSSGVNNAYNLYFGDGGERVYYSGLNNGLTVRPVSGENKIQLPTVTTNDVTNITSSSATCGGNVTSDGNTIVTSRGVCWGTYPNPTINDNKTVDGNGTGSFTSNLTNLTENTTYYVRAYATNEKGTSYGEEKSFKTMEKTVDQTITVNGVSFTMIKVEGGTFQMGATSEQGSDVDSGEKPVHSVTLSDYYIGETEVTQKLWEAVMGSNPSHFWGDERPVEQVSWNDSKEFIEKLNNLTGKNFRLPTEAEWEYAARGGNKSQGYKYSGSNTIGNVAWYWDNSSSATHNVKTKSPNELGIYDMSGNVYEWCEDWYGSYSSGSQTNPTGPSSGSYRVFRCGSWGSVAWSCRVSIRGNDDPVSRYSYYGFRLALSQ